MTPPPRRTWRLRALAVLALLGPALVIGEPAGGSPTGGQPATTQSAAFVPLRADSQAVVTSGGSSLAGMPLTLLAERIERRTGLAPFVAIGFSWVGEGLEVEVRTQLADGRWSEVADLHAEYSSGDDGREAGRDLRRYTDPLALGRTATGYEVTIPPDVGDLRVHFIREDPVAGQGVAPQRLEVAAAADGIPGPDGIRSRSAWGARQRVQTSGCGSGSHRDGRGCVADNGVNNAVVHHTVNSNTYAASAVPQMLRAIQAFHIDVRGWDDIAYNFVVDRFGTIWEGRAGGPDHAVVGAHTGGFNTGSVGVSVLGTFDNTVPSDAALESVAQVIAWKFAQRALDPLGNTVVTSRGGEVHPPGTLVPVANISGHRDLGQTGCPGTQLYSRLQQIRERTAQILPLYTGEVPDFDRSNGQLRIGGFALRRDTSAPVSVRLEIDGTTVATAVANRPRNDMAARWGTLGANHGFEFLLPVTLSMRRACIFEQASGTLIGCREVNPTTPPFGDFSSAIGKTGPPRIEIDGWAIEPDDSGVSPLHVYVDGVFATTVWTGVNRLDVAAAYPRYGSHRGFTATIPSSLGAHNVCIYAINVPAGDHTLLGCRGVVVGTTTAGPTPPTGSLDGAVEFLGVVIVGGWAADPDSAEPLFVHVYVDGEFNYVVANTTREDVAAAFPAFGPSRGFVGAVGASPGPRNVCAYAINDNLAGPHTFLGCRNVVIPEPNTAPPLGGLDIVAAQGSTARVAGWAFDPDTADPIQVHVYAGGPGVPTIASGVRLDIPHAFPGRGANHGFDLSVPLPSGAPGTRRVCIYAINDNPRAAHTTLGCRSL